MSGLEVYPAPVAAGVGRLIGRAGIGGQVGITGTGLVVGSWTTMVASMSEDTIILGALIQFGSGGASNAELQLAVGASGSEVLAAAAPLISQGTGSYDRVSFWVPPRIAAGARLSGQMNGASATVNLYVIPVSRLETV